jgi:hypothetical protein
MLILSRALSFIALLLTVPNHLVSMGTPHAPEANSQRREIGDLAVWTLSSAKPGNGVEQLRDDSVSTFWQ